MADVWNAGSCTSKSFARGTTYLDCQIYAHSQPLSMPPFIYTPEGQQIAQLLWQETIDELSFACVGEIIDQELRQ